MQPETIEVLDDSDSDQFVKTAVRGVPEVIEVDVEDIPTPSRGAFAASSKTIKPFRDLNDFFSSSFNDTSEDILIHTSKKHQFGTISAPESIPASIPPPPPPFNLRSWEFEEAAKERASKHIRLTESPIHRRVVIPRDMSSSPFISELSEIDSFSAGKAEQPRTVNKSLPKQSTRLFVSSDFDSIIDDSKDDPIEVEELRVDPVRISLESSPPIIHTSINNKKRSANSQDTTKSRSKKKDLEQTDTSYTQKQLKDANKIRNREDIMTEMAICFEKSLLEAFEKECDTSRFIDIGSSTNSLPLISWSRKSKAIYDVSKDLFIPVPKASCPLIVEQDIAVLYYETGCFLLEKDSVIRDSLSQLRKKYSTVILLLEGYDQYVQHLRVTRNRKYTQQVRAAMGDDISNRRSNDPDPTGEEKQDPDQIEEFIITLQIRHRINVFPVRNKIEALDWLESFTYTVGGYIYDKSARNLELATIGTIKSGSNSKESYLESLKQFKFMTAPAADRIHNEYKSLRSLYLDINRTGKLKKGPDGKNLIKTNIEKSLKSLLSSEDPNQVVEW